MNDHPVLWDISKDGPWRGTAANQRLWDSRLPNPGGRNQMVIDDSEIAVLSAGGSLPMPHQSDRFKCHHCGKYWQRMDGDYHRERNYNGEGGNCKYAPEIEYIHPWPPQPTPPQVAQGAARSDVRMDPLSSWPLELGDHGGDDSRPTSPLGRFLLRLAALCRMVAEKV